MADTASVTQRRQVLLVIWLGQLGSIALFVVVGFVLTQMEEPGEGMLITVTLRPLFWVLAAVLAFASLWWRRTFAAAALRPEAAGRLAADAWNRLQVHCLIVWAMSEAPAILGLVLAVLSRDLGDLLPFAAAGAVLLYVHRPAVWPQPG
jgi:hypothetical protein